MKKRFSKLMAIAMVFALIVAFAAIPASAAGYTPIPGTQTTFTKDVVVDADANIPHETFSFTIESGTAQAATASTVAVHAGPNPSAVSVGTASFTSNHTTIPGTPADSTDTTKKYAEETVTINFSGVTFNEPGIYRYLLKETAGTTAGMTYDNRTLSLDVYVTDNNGTLQVSEHVLHEGQGTISSNSTSGSNGADVKVDGFINTSASHQIEFGKEVTGNQGSKDKYFAVKIQLTPTNGYVINDASTFPAIMTSAEKQPTPSAATNPSYTAALMAEKNNVDYLTGGQLKGGHTFYLKDGQYITIQGLPDGVTYTVSETPEDYTQINGITSEVSGKVDDQQNPVNYSDPITGTLSQDIKTGFVNNKNGVIPTGVLLTVAPFAIGLLLFGALAIFFIARKRKRAEEE
nr:FctA domain-containing protein [uncultured Ruminococcus sp.]